MKKVFAILAVVAFVSFAACKSNANKNTEEPTDDATEVTVDDNGADEGAEEPVVETPSK